MARVTKKILKNQLDTINMLLERPVLPFASEVGEPVRFAVGHISLEHSLSGYSIEEICSENGAAHCIASGLTANEAYYILRGILHGITLRNAHLGELLLRSELHKAGLSTADHPLYNNPNKDKLRVINHTSGEQSVIQV